MDLIWRLVDAGWRVRYDPRVVVAHDDGRRLVKRFHYGTSAAPLSHRHPGRLAPLTLPPRPALLAPCRALLRRRGIPTGLAVELCLKAAVDTWLATAGHRPVRPSPPGRPATLGDVAYGWASTPAA